MGNTACRDKDANDNGNKANISPPWLIRESLLSLINQRGNNKLVQKRKSKY